MNEMTSNIHTDLEVKTKRVKPWRWLLLAMLVFILFFTPVRTTVLILGIDRVPDNSWAGRSDTMILASLPPGLPQFSLLSIPRDLWVVTPANGENRINTAHYFAELERANTGMAAADQVVETNLGIKVNYVIRLKFEGFIDVIDAMGGIDINLPVDMSGLTAGDHHLDGTEALRFVRDRAGSDDFFRQQRGQMIITAISRKMINPLNWVRLPPVVIASVRSVQSNIPFWLYPRLVYASLFSAVYGIDAHTFERDMTTSWTTEAGAQVLLPNWEKINPLLYQLFRQ